MSRTNHYWLCPDCRSDDERCGRHPKYQLRHGAFRLEEGWVTYSYDWTDEPIHPARHIDGRRPWRRKSRWPKHSWRSVHSGPPRWWWQEKHARVRRIQDREVRRDPDGGVSPWKKLIDLRGCL